LSCRISRRERTAPRSAMAVVGPKKAATVRPRTVRPTAALDFIRHLLITFARQRNGSPRCGPGMDSADPARSSRPGPRYTSVRVTC
jgi:hypothetical protein